MRPRPSRRPFPILSILAILAALLYASYRLNHAIVPFLLSLGLAYVLNPAINFFETRGIRRELVVFACYTIIVAFVTLLANSLLPTVTQELALLQEQAPVYLNHTKQLLLGAQVTIANSLPFGTESVQDFSIKMYAPVLDKLQELPRYVLGLFPLLSLIFLVPFITFFLLLDSGKVVEKFIQTCPSRYVEQALHLISELDTSIGNYLRGTLLVAGAVGGASFLGLSLLGVHYALGLALLSGISSLVPTLGIVIAAFIAFFIASFQFGSVWTGVQVLVLYALIESANRIALQTIMSKHSIQLHPLMFLLALMVGSELFGFTGVLFAVPVACITKALLQVAWSWYTTESRLHVPTSFEAAATPYL